MPSRFAIGTGIRHLRHWPAARFWRWAMLLAACSTPRNELTDPGSNAGGAGGAAPDAVTTDAARPPQAPDGGGAQGGSAGGGAGGRPADSGAPDRAAPIDPAGACAPGFLRCRDQCLVQNGDACCAASDCPAHDHEDVLCQDSHCSYSCSGDAIACENTCLGLDKPSCCGANKTTDADGNGVPDCQENLVLNGQFAKDLAGWRPEFLVKEATLEWSPMDAAGDSDSGSIKVSNVRDFPRAAAGAGYKQAVELKGGATYQFVADYFIPPGQTVAGAAQVALDTKNTPEYETVELGRIVGVWTRAKVTFTVVSPDRFSYVRVLASREVGAAPFVVLFDNVVLRR
jgi:hypothetical protein